MKNSALKIQYSIIGLVLFCFLVCSPISAKGQDNEKLAEQIDALAQPYIDANKFRAATVGIVRKGKVLTRSYGQMSESDATKPDEMTIYELGSISKVFTGILLADAVAQDQVTLDQTIGTLVEGLQDSNEKIANSITLQQLSQHMSGLPRMPSNIAPENPNNPFDGYDRAMLLEYLKTAKTNSRPGTKHAYSNLGTGLLGDLLSQKSGKSYEQMLRERIFQPLDMQDASVTVVGEKTKRFAPPYNAALMKDTRWDFDALAGCGAIRATTNDMIKFMQANIDPPENAIGKALNRSWKKSLNATRQHPAMGLGWMISGDGSTRWHNGQTGGYQTMMLINRELKTAVVVLSNTAGSGIDSLGESIFQVAVGMKVEPRAFAERVDVDETFVNPLVGKYQLAPGVVIDVQAKGNRMTAQITGQQALSIVPESNTEWSYEAVQAKLVFEVPDIGPATKVTLLQNGRKMPSLRIAD